MFFPKNAILPLSLCRLPTRILINVDLPEPFFPINPTVSLVEIVKDASCNLKSEDLYCLFTHLSLTMLSYPCSSLFNFNKTSTLQ